MPLVRQGGGRYDLACYVNYFTWIPPPPVTATLAGEFSYRDKKLGDSQPVTVATAPDVFQPTSTTVLLLRATRRVLAHRPPPRSVLDLGCGCGVVGVVLAKLLPSTTHVCGSDLSAAAV